MSNKKRKYKIKYEKERVLISDILPFEVPLFFSNRKFYNFLSRYNKNGESYQKKVPDFIKTNLLGLRYESNTKKWVSDTTFYTIPFNFEIRHKEDKPRVLSVIHPKNQIKVANFYDKYKSLLVYYGNRSHFSLRKIHSVSKEEYYDDDLHQQRYDDKNAVEEVNKEYKSFSSFFTYENYSIIYKFFESTEFHKEEKKFSKMIKTDISRCFDRVYTHSFSWGIFGKKFIKNNINSFIGKNGRNFVNEFDELMQKMNYNETNGIVIGPEFSRIFSEIILQSIDNNIQNALAEPTDESAKLVNKIDYSIHRYIDDYFIFYNNDSDLEKIKKVLISKLQDYNFSINDLKTKYFTKPLITDETIAKNEIKKLFQEKVFVKKEEDGFVFKISPTSIKTEIKQIIYKNNLKYESILNYIFHLFSKRVAYASTLYDENINELNESEQKEFIKQLFNFIWGVLDVVFFLYSAEPRVTQTISISNIISDILHITKTNNSKNEANNEYLHKKIYDEIYTAIRINSTKKWSNLEIIYLITILRELGSEYVLSNEFIKKNLLENTNSKSYFEIISILFYIHEKSDHQEIFDNLITLIKDKIKSEGEYANQSSEIVLLVIDIVANPDIQDDIKKDILTLYDKKLTKAEKVNIIKYIAEEDIAFTDWGSFNFRNSVKQKKRLRVY